MSGWIKLHRQVSNNSLWTSEPFTRGQAWIDLLMIANFKDSYYFKRGVRVDVKRGEIGRSTVELADRWKWSRGKVNRFLSLLEKEEQIVQQKMNVTTLISIVNYDTYQQDDTASATPNVQQTSSKRTHIKNDKKEEKDNINIDFDLLINFYNYTFGRTTRTLSTKAKKQIKDRMKEGYTKKDLQQALLNAKNDSYHIETNFRYITLEFISRPDKFERFSQSHTHNVKPKMI